MAPTILVVGATGNTGRSVVETLPKLIKDSKTLSQHRILALTRSKDSPTAQKLAAIPNVELAEQNWIEINAEWLREHEVQRVFIASHNEPTHFAEEGQFLNEALRAGVQYVVRISTTNANVVADFPAYYPRSHWAIEQMLEQPEYKAMQWTSLQPNVFFAFVLGQAAELIKQYRKTGKQGSLGLLLDADAPVGVIDAWDVGILAAHLLARDDTSAYNGKRLVMNGPEDLSGRQIVEMVEKEIGVKVEDVKFRDVSFIHQWADSLTKGSKNVIRSIEHAAVTGWEGKCSASTTSKEVLELCPPQGTAKKALAQMLGQ